MAGYISGDKKRTVQSLTCCECDVWILMREQQTKLQALELDYLGSASVSILQNKSPLPPLGLKCKQNNEF